MSKCIELKNKTTHIILSLIFTFLFLELNASGLSFKENKGQWGSDILFKAKLGNGSIDILKDKIVFLQIDPEVYHELHENRDQKISAQAHSFHLKFEGANEIKVRPENPEITLHHYFIGPSKYWRSNIRAYKKLTLENLYEGIDLEIYCQEDGNIKYQFIVKPGANPAKVKMTYTGLDDLYIRKGKLHLKTRVSEIIDEDPYSFQEINGKRNFVKSFYELEGNTVSIKLGRYNEQETLIIDPIVVFSTYSGSQDDNWGFTATFDNQGNAFGGGTIYSDFPGSQGYLVSPGAFQTSFAGGIDGSQEAADYSRDAVIIKLTPDGRNRVFATYLGGSNNEQPHSMVTNSRGELCILGTTKSIDFPLGNNPFQNLPGGGWDIFVSIISPDGSVLVNSTYLGGRGIDGHNGATESNGNGYVYFSPLAYNYGDVYRGEIIVNSNDEILIHSTTQSNNSQNFPVRNGFNNNFGGVQDAFFARFNSDASNLLSCSYIGGISYEAGNGLALSPNGDIYLCGGTSSTTLGFNLAGQKNAYQGGTGDGFLLRISADGTQVLNGTYIGTTAYDQAYFVQVDKRGNPFVTGQSAGVFDITPPIYGNAEGGQFIMKFLPDLSNFTRSTVFGAGGVKPQLSPSAFLVDECERIFFSGWGGETNDNVVGKPHGNTRRLETTPDAWQRTTDGSDFYLAVFSIDMEQLLYATFLGGGSGLDVLGDHVDGGTSRFDAKGVVYQSVCGGCATGAARLDFPTTPGSWSPNNGSFNCNNVIFKLDFENLNRAPLINDQTFSLGVGENLNFNFNITDPDFYDTLEVQILENNIVRNLPGIKPRLTRTNTNTRTPLSFNLDWTPGCEHVGLDTLSYTLVVRDKGCPDSKSDTGIIKIAVTPPPVPEPPNVVCIRFLDDNTIRVEWSEFENDTFFSHYVVKRVNPNGTEVVLGEFQENDTFVVDNLPNSGKVNNYCYYIYGVNICDQNGDTSYRICSADQFNSPIDPTESFTVTVEDNKNLRLIWYKSKEDDFFSYQILRKPKSATHLNYEFYSEIRDINDTTFLDLGVEVDKISYCYQIVVTDRCGFISAATRRSCSIVLEGESQPYTHLLDWIPYNDWENGVERYELWRFDDRKQDILIGTLSPNGTLNYTDTSFDYDYGAYWYYVRAFEQNGNLAVSQSNTVRLVQKPLLHVPTGFTNNSDRLNDVWGIKDIFVKEYHLRVYNRWGQLVFETRDKNFQWDGNYKGKQREDNVFIWLVTYTGWDDSRHYQKGTVTLLN